jgi:hypothetical protein
MTTFCTAIGELLMTAVMFAVPILCTCSIAFGWDWLISYFLVVLTVVDYFAFFVFVKEFIEY